MFANEEERSMRVDTSNVEMHDDEDTKQARLIPDRVDSLDEVSSTSKVSSLGVTENTPRRSGRVRVELHR